MDELVRWLGEQLDEDERIARAAGGRIEIDHHWFEVHSANHPGVVGTERGLLVTTDRALREHAAHIAEHDPARVLREIDAKRRIIRAHAKWCQGDCEAKYPDGGFDAAHYWSLKALAAVYADRPGYREEWRP